LAKYLIEVNASKKRCLGRTMHLKQINQKDC